MSDSRYQVSIIIEKVANDENHGVVESLILGSYDQRHHASEVLEHIQGLGELLTNKED